ncbi:hypothetical protein [Elizabethkingia meningoseptica]|uniref:hypothetical protein n=1 Tax=Elizabethkingia meningoseptica TaxID=238 RepID=UPI0023AF670E|nr:hypothetical protein [Elizabethkingia meningoseptica]MDE5525665.1 hypothetical protein [Elizabethkingia meningoseptica]
MITSLKKDELLNALCDVNDFESLLSLDLKSLLTDFHIEFNELTAILNQFQRLGFISELNARRHSSDLFLCIHLEALDFKNRGGFLMQEETLRLTLEKLKIEVDNLSNDFPDKAALWTSITANIATCISFMLPK